MRGYQPISLLGSAMQLIDTSEEPTGEVALTELQAKLPATLPNDFVDFLRSVGPGQPRPDVFVPRGDGNQPIAIQRFLRATTDGDDIDGIVGMLELLKREYSDILIGLKPAQVLPVAVDIGGSPIAYLVDGDRFEDIVYIYLDGPLTNPGEAFEDFFVVAKSFSDLLSRAYAAAVIDTQ